MRDENRGELVRAVQILEQRNNHFAGPEIQIAGRLVGEQDARVAGQSTGQSDALLLSARQFSRAMGGPVP